MFGRFAERSLLTERGPRGHFEELEVQGRVLDTRKAVSTAPPLWIKLTDFQERQALTADAPAKGVSQIAITLEAALANAAEQRNKSVCSSCGQA